MRVLIVDDCSDSVLILSRLLVHSGHDVEAARSGDEAIKLASVFMPDAVFLDLWMPQMDGYEVAKRLRQLDGLAGIRIIALSGAKPEPERDAAAGIDAHLLKPAGLKKMLAALQREPA